MRGLIRDDQPGETWFAKVISDTVLADRWRQAGRMVPEAQAALERAATKKAALAGQLLMMNLASAHGPREGKTVGARHAAGLGGVLGGGTKGFGE